jgi:hypothetical protein
MRFQIAETRLENTSINYLQSKSSPASDSTESILPYFNLDHLSLKNVSVNYNSIPDKLLANIRLDDFKLEVPKADLKNQEIKIGQLVINNSDVRLKKNIDKEQTTLGTENDTISSSIDQFTWPDWNINVKGIVLQDNYISYQTSKDTNEIRGFNPENILISDFTLKASDLLFSKEQSTSLHLEKISFKEKSGIELNQFTFDAALNPTNFSLKNLVAQTKKNVINSDLLVEFNSITEFINKPEESNFKINIKQYIIDLNEFFEIQPELKNITYLPELAQNKIKGGLNANGKLSKINLSKLLIKWGENTSINSTGVFNDVTNVNNLIVNIDNFVFKSTKSDVTNFISQKDLGISLPRNLTLEARFNGKINNFKSNALLKTSDGRIRFEGDFKQQRQIAYHSKVDITNLNLGKILKNPKIGKLNFNIKSSGNGNSLDQLNATLVSNFSKIGYNGYDYSALKLEGQLANGNGGIQLMFDDENLNLKINSNIQLDSVAPKISVDFNLDGIDLYALGFTEKEVKAKLILNANFKGNTTAFDFDTKISEGVAVYDEKSHHLGALNLISKVNNDSSTIDITSDFLNGKLRVNSGLEQTTLAIKQQIEHYFLDSINYVDTIKSPVKLKVDMRLTKTDLITDFLVSEIKEMDTLKFIIDFDQKENKLDANLSLPYIDYANNTIDRLKLEINSTDNNADFKLGFNKVNAPPLLINHSYFDGQLNKGLLKINFNSFDNEQEMYVIKTETTGNFSDFKFHIDNDKLILNNENWSIPNGNEIHILNDKVTINDFNLSKQEQTIRLANNFKQSNQENIGVEFTNFNLASILSLFNKDKPIATGDINGTIIAIDPLNETGFITDLGINDLEVLTTPFGQLSLKANSKDNKNFNIKLGLKSEDINLILAGDYASQNTESELDFKLILNKIGMKTISSLSNEALKDASGNISGELAIKGNVSDPDYKGHLQFNESTFNISELNAQFYLKDDKILIDNSTITLNQFTIQDEQKNKFTLDGNISTIEITDPKLDLTLKAKNFQALNSTIKDNDLFYGTINFNLDGTVIGKVSKPKADLKIKINESTDFTYLINDNEAQLEKSDGIVEFVNKKDPDNILTRKSDSNNVVVFGGVELHSIIKVDKGAKFGVITDPKTGDNLTVSGDGNLDFNIEENGRMTMSGLYEINKGEYNVSLYNLVKRKFNLEPGSSINWRGSDPFDAELNITAKYSIETSASDLMAGQTAGLSEEIKSKYRQKLPFWVFLNVKGDIDQPQLTFDLGMPEDSRGAIDGSVYSRIRQLNTEEDALSKQVFSLLVLKKFYPTTGSDGSSGGAASLVRNNVNDALSDQLNSFSNKLTGNTGIELDFGLNSYTDYQSETTQKRTDLNVSAQKKLLDDRLIVQVGSNVNIEGSANPGEEDPVIGNASIQYLLTKDGRWRLKGFRNNEYENIVDGQVFVNGISIIFQRQFNKFNELFKNISTENESSESDKKEPEIDSDDKQSKTEDK